MDELTAIKNHHIKNHTIMIDDVRLFADGVDKQIPYKIEDIKNFIVSINPEYKFTYEEGFTDKERGIYNDILVAYVEV
jgi:hypothetical protein